MTNHVKIYLDYYGYCQDDSVVCDWCGVRLAVDIHHIIPRSKFGKKTKHLQDSIENLIALCRQCHDEAHAEKISKQELKQRNDTKRSEKTL